MEPPISLTLRKSEREHRLSWQSVASLTLVLASTAAGLAARISQARTPATAEGLVICAAFGLLVWLVKAATPLAAVTGFLLTSCMYLATVDQPNGGWLHTALPPGLTLFLLAFAATRFRRGQKEQSGLAESRRGRGASQVAANMGVAALAALILPRLGIASGIAYAVIAAALAEAAADTVSSEIGQAVGGMPILVTSLQRVPPGTDGAISFAGTATGCAAAAVVVLAAMPTLRLTPQHAAAAWLAAICGLFADTLIGATLERWGWLNNDAVNFVSTAIATLLALVWLPRL